VDKKTHIALVEKDLASQPDDLLRSYVHRNLLNRADHFMFFIADPINPTYNPAKNVYDISFIYPRAFQEALGSIMIKGVIDL